MPFFKNRELPTLRAAIDEKATSRAYYGPSGFMELRDYRVVVGSNDLSNNKVKAQRL